VGVSVGKALSFSLMPLVGPPVAAVDGITLGGGESWSGTKTAGEDVGA
jgi:hypothetical protein